MPYYYFDSTALVKRYSMERGTRVVNKLMVKRGKVAILPMWSVTDFYSALSVRAEQGEITRDDSYSVLFKFEMEASQGLFQFISPTMDAYLAAKELILDYPALRSPQLLHLALALELKPLRLTVVRADKQLLAACRPVCWGEELAELARKHNNANIICIPARFVRDGDAEKMLDVFMNTAFEGGRHTNRVEKIPV